MACLQEATTQEQAAITRLHQDLQQTQQQLQHQQQNMAAMQAQIQQLDHRANSNNNLTNQLQGNFSSLQEQLDSLSDKVSYNQKVLSAQQVAATAAEARLRNELQEQMQHVQDELLQQQQQLEKCSSEGQDALDKCEQLRQAGVVTTRRLDAVGCHIQDAVQPTLQRYVGRSKHTACFMSCRVLGIERAVYTMHGQLQNLTAEAWNSMEQHMQISGATVAESAAGSSSCI